MGQLGLVYGGEEGRGREEGEHLGVLTQLEALHTLQVQWRYRLGQLSSCDLFRCPAVTSIPTVSSP